MTIAMSPHFVYNIGSIMRGGVPVNKSELLKAVDAVETIAQLFELVQREKIDIRMHSFTSASNLPPKMLDLTDTQVSPLEKLKFAVKSAIENTRYD